MTEQKRPAIRSSIGNVMATGTPQKKVLTVDDQSGYKGRTVDIIEQDRSIMEQQPEQDDSLYAELQAAKLKKKHARDRLNEGAKQRIEILLGISRLTDDVEIDGTTFSIRSLKSKEQKAVIEYAAKENLNISYLMEIRLYTLAHSIYEIDGQPVEIILGTNDVEMIADVINDMDESLVNHLYSRYEKMVKQNKNKLNPEENEKKEELTDEIKK